MAESADGHLHRGRIVKSPAQRLLYGLIASVFPFATYACGLDDSVVLQVKTESDGGVGADSATNDATLNGNDANRGDANAVHDAAQDSGADSGPSALLVYANTQTDLYSFDVISSTLTHIATLSSCGSNAKDLALDNDGQLYLFDQNDAIYEVAMNGTCSGSDVLSSIAGDDLKIAARAAGTPSVVAVDPGHKDYYSIDPLSAPHANVTDISSGEFTDNPPYDVACSQGGTCWTALDHTKCSGASATDSCLVSFPADGSSAATALGKVGALPAGLAYAGGALYSFNGDGTIDKITLGGTPTASAITVTLAGGTTQPSAWLGAASSSAYP